MAVSRFLLLGALVATLASSACGGSGGGSAGTRATATPGPSPTATPGPTPVPPAANAGPSAMRRLTSAQYRATVADVLGEDAVAPGRFEPDQRVSGLLAVGASDVSVTPAGLEQYDAMAREVARRALDPAHRDEILPCRPGATVDDACAAAFLQSVGRRLLRRPVDAEELAGWTTVAREAASQLGDFHAGLEVALSALLVSPEFLFRVDETEVDPQHGGERFTSLSMAHRLSYLLWSTTPDEELLDAGERGDLVETGPLAAQVDRLLASERLETSIRQLFADAWKFDAIEQGLVRKDPEIFPAFSQEVISDAEEQTLRVVVDQLLARDGDYRDLFTTRRSFMTRPLGILYRVPVRSPDDWEEWLFADDDRRAGVLGHASLLALHSHPGRSSPTLRGKFVREAFLCQDVPPPPGNVDFSMFADEANQKRTTARERLQAHVSNPACAGCHALMDPIGLALENFDGIGIERDTENGATIDASGSLDGEAYSDAAGLGLALSHHPELGPCFVETVFRYAVGRNPVTGERAWLAWAQERFEESGFRLRPLLRAIVLGDAFRRASGPRAAAMSGPTNTVDVDAIGAHDAGTGGAR
ncbi:MAG: DUF1588 domain-containing protein [Alphaproteobacteria bacterium]